MFCLVLQKHETNVQHNLDELLTHAHGNNKRTSVKPCKDAIIKRFAGLFSNTNPHHPYTTRIPAFKLPIK